MVKRATRQDLAEALAQRTGVSVNKANIFLNELADKVKYELYYESNSVKLFGICKIYRKDREENQTVSTGYLAHKFKKETGISIVEALLLESEIASLILDLLRDGFKVVVTGLVSFEVDSNKENRGYGTIKCASSSSLRGSENTIPCRVSLDKMFRSVLKKGFAL